MELSVGNVTPHWVSVDLLRVFRGHILRRPHMIDYRARIFVRKLAQTCISHNTYYRSECGEHEVASSKILFSCISIANKLNDQHNAYHRKRRPLLSDTSYISAQRPSVGEETSGKSTPFGIFAQSACGIPWITLYD